MRDWQRATRECEFDDLLPEIIAAFRKHFEKHEWGSPESSVLICCETISEKLKSGFFGNLFGGAKTIQHTGILLSRERLVWYVYDSKNPSIVSAARLSDIEVRDYDLKLIADSGIDVFGFVNQSSERVLAFIGLGEDAAARKFRQVLKEAIEKARILNRTN